MKEKNILEEQALKKLAEKHENFAKEQAKQDTKDADEWHRENK